MITLLRRWLRSRRRPKPIIRLWDADYKEIILPRGVKIVIHSDNGSTTDRIGNVDLRRRADDV